MQPLRGGIQSQYGAPMPMERMGTDSGKDERRAKAQPFTPRDADVGRVLEATTALATEASKQPTAFLIAAFDLVGGLTVSTCGLEDAHVQSILSALPIIVEDLKAIAEPAPGAIAPSLPLNAAQRPGSRMMAASDIELLRASLQKCRVSLKI